jgi:hypothetical protein
MVTPDHKMLSIDELGNVIQQTAEEYGPHATNRSVHGEPHKPIYASMVNIDKQKQ